jgi:ribonuclease G
MNKELFVSSTPHETKVGMVEDDLLAEIYLERENEYTLAGSIYKGRVTRVLPGMQSAFVDIGLERDAFLYVSDFMELEEHDEDLTESIPANRNVPDMRTPVPSVPVANEAQPFEAAEGETRPLAADHDFDTAEESIEASGAPSAEGSFNRDPQNQDRDRGGFRGRRRRRGGRRDGRDRDRDSRDRGPEPRAAVPFVESAPAPVAPIPHFSEPRRAQPPQFGPPAGYQPIVLPGESISKYRGIAQPQPSAPPARYSRTSAPPAETVQEPSAPLSGNFPDDEPIFASPSTASESHQPAAQEEIPAVHAHATAPTPIATEPVEAPIHESVESASTSVDWNREFHRRDASAAASAILPEEATSDSGMQSEELNEEEEAEESQDLGRAMLAVADDSAPVSRETALAFASPGTLEEETIDDDEAEAVRYEQSSDEGYDEFEEETQAAGAFSDVRATVEEIHMSSLADAGIAPPELSAETEEDSEEIELEEAQAKAEALLDAEARGNGTVDARVEVRAPANAGYTQRAPRPRPDRTGDRPGYDRRGGGRRPGGRRFPRREAQEVPKISDLLKEGQEILVQIAKEPIGKKGARITSHIALPGRFLVYMPTVNHTGVSRKIASDEERQRLKRIVMSERENGHGGFIVRTAAASASEEELRADIRFLKGLWNDIKGRAEASKPPALIYHDLNVVERVLRDQVTSDFSVIWVDTEPEYERILRFFNRFQPALVKRVKLYTKETPLFEQFGLKDEMDKALKSKVWLKSGGYIVINQTEALVAIDINTGKYVGKTSRLEDTIVKTNVDAIKEIVRQIRLRDLGGIIIIDFIDMDERRNRQRVMQALEE